jgi:D-3-phosphoglycerate dehydrogenase
VELPGRTIGLVGYGNVGRGVARVAGALGMQVLAHDPWLPSEAFEDGVETVTLDDLLGRSEFVSLHARVTPENENLMDAGAFARMRPGSFFINTARETLVDEPALLAAVRSRHLAGAALDVVRPAPIVGRNPLLDEPRVVITPHIGGATDETIERGVAMVGEEIARLSAGLQPVHAR